MISVTRVVSPAVIKSYVQRNGGVGTFQGLAVSQGAVGRSKASVESSWLIAKGGSGKTLNEQWGTYLGSKGYTTGTLKERMVAFFKNGTQA